jgi:hypothetical protein
MMPQNFEIAAKSGPGERKLDVFVGRWHTTGTSEPSQGVTGRIDVMDNFEWLPGETLMVHAWNGQIGGESNRGLEIYNHDAAKGKFYSHFFGSPGVGRVYEMTVDAAGIWTVVGPTERGRYAFQDGGDTLVAIWEQTTDGVHWTHLCEARSVRTR